MAEQDAASLYRASGIDIGRPECDFHRLQGRLQDDGELVGTVGVGEVWVHRLETDDLIEAALQFQPLQNPDGVGSVGVREDLQNTHTHTHSDRSKYELYSIL